MKVNVGDYVTLKSIKEVKPLYKNLVCIQMHLEELIVRLQRMSLEKIHIIHMKC